MALRRIGLVASLGSDEITHFHRAALVLTRAAHSEERYGRAAAGSLEQDAGVHRLPDVGGCVVWGKDDEAMARLARRNPCAVMLFVLPRKLKATSPLADALQRLAEKHGSDCHVVTFSKRSKATAWDVGTGRRCEEASDITRPPQQQAAPSVPRQPGEPIGRRRPRPGVYKPNTSPPPARAQRTTTPYSPASAPPPAAKPAGKE